MFEYWDPATFHQAKTDLLEGLFTGEECVECHASITPGIVKDWQASGHAKPQEGKGVVSCASCHGSDHQKLVFPTPATCGGCHAQQHADFVDERKFGFPSHALAMERAVDAVHFVDKPKSEVMACLQCHSVAGKCDSCHSRHRFDPAEARRPEACITCHSGPPHPDDEAYFNSAHGRIYLAEGGSWDWSKPLVKGNYKVPTCAYCHLQGGKHQVADKAIHKFGIRQVNPATGENRIKRKRWLVLCMDCHPANKAAGWLAGLDAERERSWRTLYLAEAQLKGLRADGLLYPAAAQRPPYPLDWLDKLWPRERIGFYEGQASALYNVSPIERDYFEMWYFNNLRSYKGAAHGGEDLVREGALGMELALEGIIEKAANLRRLAAQERGLGVVAPDPRPWWLDGEYTLFNREHN